MQVKRFALLLALLASVTSLAVSAEPGRELSLLGLYDFRPFDSAAVYAHGIGTGFIYKSQGLSSHVPLRFAVQLDAMYYGARDPDFGAAVVLRPGGTVEMPVRRTITDRLALRSSAYIGYRHALERHTFLERPTFGARPVAVAGLRHSLAVAEQVVAGIGGEYAMLFENDMRHSFTVYIHLASMLSRE